MKTWKFYRHKKGCATQKKVDLKRLAADQSASTDLSAFVSRVVRPVSAAAVTVHPPSFPSSTMSNHHTMEAKHMITEALQLSTNLRAEDCDFPWTKAATFVSSLLIRAIDDEKLKTVS
jgi:hypothetical protein